MNKVNEKGFSFMEILLCVTIIEKVQKLTKGEIILPRP